MKWIAYIATLAFGFSVLWSCIKPPEASATQQATTSANSSASIQYAIPEVIVKLRAEIRGKKPSEVASIIVQKFGPPNRDVGSGRALLQWDIGHDRLTLDANGGPPFFTSSDGASVRLIDTENTAGDNIISNFGMTTLPDPANHGTRFSLGSLSLKADGEYEYAADKFMSREQLRVAPNFFFDHPRGKYSVAYPVGVTAQSLLENLPDNSSVAVIRFSADPAPGTTHSNAVMELKLLTAQNHLLNFTSETVVPLNYVLDSFWHNVWGNPAQFKWDYSFPTPLNERQ